MKQGRPAAHCTACEFAWNSAAMAEGLRLIGSCPRCGGELEFDSEEAEPVAEPVVRDVEPARVMGLTRPPRA
jgi:hypothetical protein